jgi:hypothetical protein
MRADLGRPGPLIPEKILADAEIGATLQEMGHEALPDGMGREVVRNACSRGTVLHSAGKVRQAQEGGYQDLSPRRRPKVGLYHGEWVLLGETASIAF